MNYLLAPDSFKGTMSARTVCEVMTEVIRQAQPTSKIISLPIADGGEGFLQAVTTADERFSRTVCGPLKTPVEAQYGVREGMFIIEMAQCSGLILVEEEQRNAELTTSYGVGEMLRFALENGYEKIMIGIGGSATNDGGAGMLSALGAKFYDAAGNELKYPALIDIQQADFTTLLDTSKVELRIASDVENPLVGQLGATYVFGEQKGLQRALFPQYDRKMNDLADLYEAYLGKPLRQVKGTGAAGGIGAALLGFFNAKMESGADLVLGINHYEELVQKASLVITGEGRSDRQTLHGKAPFRIAEIAKKYDVPTILISGSIEHEEILEKYFAKLYSVVSEEITLHEALTNPKKALASCMKKINFQ